MTVILDAGAFVAVERGDCDLMAIIKRERLADRVPVTHGGVVGQVWRGGTGRQANLARLLIGVEVEPLDDGDEIYTSDPGDLTALASTAGLHIELVPT